jgi:hypothetical protein
MGSLGFGVPNWPRAGPPSYDWWSLVLPAVAILAAAWPFGLRLTRRSVVTLAVGGTVTGWMIDAIGVLPAIALGVMALSMRSTMWHRGTRSSRD